MIYVFSKARNTFRLFLFSSRSPNTLSFQSLGAIYSKYFEGTVTQKKKKKSSPLTFADYFWTWVAMQTIIRTTLTKHPNQWIIHFGPNIKLVFYLFVHGTHSTKYQVGLIPVDKSIDHIVEYPRSYVPGYPGKWVPVDKYLSYYCKLTQQGTQ